MQKLKKHALQLIKLKDWFLSYRYGLVFLTFGLYMYFFDQYRIPVAWSIYSDMKMLEEEKEEYVQLISKLREDKRDFENNYEKFAREKYFMSRTDEDVFIIQRITPKKNNKWQF